MADRVLSELAAPGGPSVLIIDDLHELSSIEAAGRLTALLTNLPPACPRGSGQPPRPTAAPAPAAADRAVAEIRAAQLRFTQDETRRFLTAAGITVPDPVVAPLHRRTEGWAARAPPSPATSAVRTSRWPAAPS